ncbi:hypothetical protein CBS147339_2266 [Penicillium roqueforti]|nr:hypothetical protein DTO012A1_8008 [Penicillium roqueforti]KAI3082386.1 hypothetical protein CBS147339_2266 [Penicillium roqueforti]KAI3098836.1 hypothetical protein CBS147338_4000 [Penicillium roqueforti]
MRDNGSYFLGHRFDISRRSISLWLIDFNLVREESCRLSRADKVEGNRPFSYEPTGLVQSVPFFFNSQLQVYMHSGEVFGMLNCGDRRKGKINSSCIFDIFKDIKDLTGAAEVRIAPCPT